MFTQVSVYWQLCLLYTLDLNVPHRPSFLPPLSAHSASSAMTQLVSGKCLVYSKT